MFNVCVDWKAALPPKPSTNHNSTICKPEEYVSVFVDAKEKHACHEPVEYTDHKGAAWDCVWWRPTRYYHSRLGARGQTDLWPPTAVRRPSTAPGAFSGQPLWRGGLTLQARRCRPPLDAIAATGVILRLLIRTFALVAVLCAPPCLHKADKRDVDNRGVSALLKLALTLLVARLRQIASKVTVALSLQRVAVVVAAGVKLVPDLPLRRGWDIRQASTNAAANLPRDFIKPPTEYNLL
jgi:hypothetical protein